MDEQNINPQVAIKVKNPTQVSKNYIILISAVLGAVILTSIAMFLWQQDELSKIRITLNKQISDMTTSNQDLTKQLAQMNSFNQDLIKQIETLQSTTQKAELAKTEAELQKEAIAKKTCTGTWQNGLCVKSTCVDSDVNDKPNDIFIKGNVLFTTQSGIETRVYDECTGSAQQVNEVWCYESPSGSGNYVQGKMVYNCPKGCLDGACTR